MSTWKLTYNKFDPDEENLREALCTLGNGYFGTRGASPETSANRVHYPGTYIAGVYNTVPTEIANRTIYNEDFVNVPNWLMFNYRIDDEPWFNRLKVKILSWKKELNFKKGILSRRVRWQDNNGRITLVESHQIVSMAQPHCGALRFTITPENYEGRVTIRSGIDGMIINAGVERYRQLNSKHLIPSSHGSFDENGIFLQMETIQSKIQITEAVRHLLFKNGAPFESSLEVINHGRERIMHEIQVDVKKQERFTVEKLVSVYTSRDQGVADNCLIAQEKVNQLVNFESVFKPHQARWGALWKRFDIEVEGDSFTQLVLRLHTFHLLQSASTYNEDIDAGMPVRGLHGEAYRGHIFWDELYVFPFYNLHAPEITRALLMYRYRRLGAAKENAKQNGHRGAMYPWQTASTGEETTQIIHLNPLSGTWGPDYSALQRHVSIAVAYNVWTYYFMSGDKDFLDRYGAEMILEIALFWSSIAVFNHETNRFDIEGVMGPDEFHEKYPGANKGGLKNNAYTNVMVVWVIDKALHIINELIGEEERIALLAKSNINEDDVSLWETITKQMTIPLDESGVIHQFEGYMDLEELNWDEYKKKYDNIHRIDRILKAEGQSPDSYKVAKQADTLMLFYVLNKEELKNIFENNGYSYEDEMMKINFDYYFPRTSHGSTLSMVVHAYIAGLLGDQKQTKDFFIESLKSDIYDTQGGTTQEGIHAGVMGGTLDLFLRSYAGLKVFDDRISLNPRLPDQWNKVRFNIRHKNIWYDVRLTADSLMVKAEPVDQSTFASLGVIQIEIENKMYQLAPGKPYTVSTKV